MTCICPHCGYDLTGEEPIEDGPFRFVPGLGFFVDGQHLGVRKPIHELLAAILRAKGRALPATTLAERIGYEGDQARCLIAVYLSKARAEITRRGHIFPVQTRRGYGFAWDRDATPEPVTRHLPRAA